MYQQGAFSFPPFGTQPYPPTQNPYYPYYGKQAHPGEKIAI